MYVEDSNQVFCFKCAVVRNRTESGIILHDGFRSFSWDFQPSKKKSSFEKEIQELFPFVTSPSKMIFLGNSLASAALEH